MALDLRPLGLTDILDRAFRLYRENFVLWLGIAAVVLVPQALLVLPLMPPQAALKQPFTPEYWHAIQRTMLVLPLTVFTSAIAQGALAVAVSERYLDRPVSIGSAYRRVGQRLGALLGADFLTILASSAAVVLLFVGSIYFYLALIFVPAVVMIEGHGPVGALKRSWWLTRGDRGRIFLLLLLAGLLQIVAGQSLKVVAGMITKAEIASSISDALAQILLIPLWQASFVLMSFDNRVRKEGFDLQIMAAQLGGGGGAGPAAPPAPTPMS